MGRTLAIDYGERRIGLAVSDPTATLAQPLPAIVRRRGKRPPIQAIIDLMDANDVDRVVVGLPLSLEGSSTEWTDEVRSFASRVAQRSNRPAFLIDERMTSVMAERAVRSIGLPRSEREKKERVDTAAAMLILQAFLDRARAGHPVEQVDAEAVDDAD